MKFNLIKSQDREHALKSWFLASLPVINSRYIQEI